MMWGAECRSLDEILLFLLRTTWHAQLLLIMPGRMAVRVGRAASGKQWNSPRGAEGATMARRVPFLLSRFPASIEHSMKLLCVCGRAASVLVSLVP